MTYVNAHPYRESPTLWAHDDCLPDEMFREHTWGDGEVTRQQIDPWCWFPVYGGEHECMTCGKVVA